MEERNGWTPPIKPGQPRAERASHRDNALAPPDAERDDGLEDGLVHILQLPLDCCAQLLTLIDHRSLARFAECTSRRLSEALASIVAPLWRSLHDKLMTSSCVVIEPPPAFGSSTLRYGGASDKERFALAYAAIHRICPRCGHTGARTAISGQGFDTSRYMHLCSWLRPTGRPHSRG